MKRAAAIALMGLACAPAAAPLKAVLAPPRARPSISIPPTHRHIAFRWDYPHGISPHPRPAPTALTLVTSELGMNP